MKALLVAVSIIAMSATGALANRCPMEMSKIDAALKTAQLSPDQKTEVEKLRKDAEAHAEEDRKRRELIEARNNADNTIYAAEKALREFGDKVPDSIKTEVDKKVADVKTAAEADDVAKIRSETEALGQVIQKIGGAVYQGQGSAAPSGEAGPTPEPETGPDVVDGEVKE